MSEIRSNPLIEGDVACFPCNHVLIAPGLNIAFSDIFPISVDQCKFMDSKMRPLYLVFENTDELGDLVRIIFKNGDGKIKPIILLIARAVCFCQPHNSNNS